MKIGSSFVSGSAAAAAKLGKVGVSLMLMLIRLMLMMLMLIMLSIILMTTVMMLLIVIVPAIVVEPQSVSEPENAHLLPLHPAKSWEIIVVYICNNIALQYIAGAAWKNRRDGGRMLRRQD